MQINLILMKQRPMNHQFADHHLPSILVLQRGSNEKQTSIPGLQGKKCFLSGDVVVGVMKWLEFSYQEFKKTSNLDIFIFSLLTLSVYRTIYYPWNACWQRLTHEPSTKRLSVHQQFGRTRHVFCTAVWIFSFFRSAGSTAGRSNTR